MAPRPFPGVVKATDATRPHGDFQIFRNGLIPQSRPLEMMVPGPAVPIIGGGLYPHRGV